jgi:hypothetical protein
MLTEANNSGRNITDFDFYDPATRERLQSWLDIAVHRLTTGENLTESDLQKVKELLKIIQKKEQYKVPYRRGERKPILLKRNEQIICWYRVTLEMHLGMQATEAKKATAERFGISLKSVEAYCTEHRKTIEHMIEKHGYDEVSYPYIEHLSWFKRGKEVLLKGFLAKYAI